MAKKHTIEAKLQDILDKHFAPGTNFIIIFPNHPKQPKFYTNLGVHQIPPAILAFTLNFKTWIESKAEKIVQ